MNRYAITFGVATALVGVLAAGSANAVAVQRSVYAQASGSCQGALPSYEGNFRKRPLAVANEGVGSAYLTCGVKSNEDNFFIDTVELYVTNRGAADVAVGCTMVDGFIDSTIGFADYYPQTVDAASGIDSAFSWSGQFSYPSISCNVPAEVEANMVYSNQYDEIGA